MNYPFVHSEEIAFKDAVVLKCWENGSITDSAAAGLIAKNNNWPVAQCPHVFADMAHSLGYFRRGEPHWEPEDEKH